MGHLEPFLFGSGDRRASYIILPVFRERLRYLIQHGSLTPHADPLDERRRQEITRGGTDEYLIGAFEIRRK